MRVQRIALTVCLVFATAIWAGVMSCELDVDEQGREIKSIEDSWSSSASPGMGVPAVDTAFAVEELEKNPLWTFETDSALAYLGRDISICNLNGDGYDDLVATAPHYDNGIYRQGRTYIFYGTASGFPESPDDTLESGVNDGNMGAVSCAGNVNGDAYDDLFGDGSRIQ
ncbi:MAG: integrin alpha [Deltaproteobacteria bacterium]|nr:integrin alpha [Deltaproteobacteria bacterium]